MHPMGTYVCAKEDCSRVFSGLVYDRRRGLVRFCSRSCGTSVKNLKHGFGVRGTKLTKEYIAWRCMRGRCNNQTHRQYKYYGGRGIKICKRWDNFLHFLADMGKAPKGMSLDRINNNGNYTPSNCRWATPLQQTLNSRQTRWITYKGETMCLAHWAKRIGLLPSTLGSRLRTWTFAQVMQATQPSVIAQFRKKER